MIGFFWCVKEGSKENTRSIFRRNRFQQKTSYARKPTHATWWCLYDYDSGKIRRLRRLTMNVRRLYHGCKRFQPTAFTKPPTGDLSRDQTRDHKHFM